MNVYAETNFVLELSFEQEQAANCQEILALCVAGDLRLIIPAYSLVEPYEKLIRQRSSRKSIQENLEVELRQLTRTASYQNQLDSVKSVYKLLLQSSDEEAKRLAHYRKILLENAEIIPLTSEILTVAAACEKRLNLQPQDAVVYSSTLSHLQRQHDGAISCFLNRNAKDFDKPEIKAELARHRCSLIYRFDQGLRFVGGQSA